MACSGTVLLHLRSFPQHRPQNKSGLNSKRTMSYIEIERELGNKGLRYHSYTFVYALIRTGKYKTENNSGAIDQ
jgi:hypothetical protein